MLLSAVIFFEAVCRECASDLDGGALSLFICRCGGGLRPATGEDSRKPVSGDDHDPTVGIVAGVHAVKVDNAGFRIHKNSDWKRRTLTS